MCIQNIKRGFFTPFCLLLAVCFLLSACGKKGEPTLKSYEKPVAPARLFAIHRESEIILLWDYPKDKEAAIKGFHLFRSSGKDFEKIAFLENDKRSYRDTNFKTGSAFTYKIVSQNLRGIVSIDSNIIEVKPQNPPHPPANITFNVEYDTVTLQWQSAGEGIVYYIYKSDKNGAYPLTPVHKEPVRGTLFKDTFNIQNPASYTIRSSTGSTIRDEGPSSEVRIDPMEFVPSAPDALQAVATQENVYLIWKEPKETWVTGYKVYREMTKGEGFQFIGAATSPSFADSENPSTKRNYRVTALGPLKEGPPAEIRDIRYTKQK